MFFLCHTLFISRLKHPWSCFSSHFCFPFIVIILSIVLSVSFLMAVIYYYYYFIRVFHWRLSVSKSPQVCRTLLSILAVFNNAVVWMVSSSKSSRPFNNPLVTVPKVLITISIIVTFMFHSFFNSLSRSRYFSLFSHSFSFILWSAWTAKSTILQIFYFVDYYKFWSFGWD